MPFRNVHARPSRAGARRILQQSDARQRIGPRRQAEFGSARVADIVVGCQRALVPPGRLPRYTQGLVNEKLDNLRTRSITQPGGAVKTAKSDRALTQDYPLHGATRKLTASLVELCVAHLA
jgi:hypothetical protein